jgi:hypothetical protein
VTRELFRLDPRYRPDRPRALRLLSMLAGYRAAEHVALGWRRLKRRVVR